MRCTLSVNCIRTISKNDGPCEAYGLSTANHGPEARVTVRAKLTDRQLQITARISAAVLDMSVRFRVKLSDHTFQTVVPQLALRA